MRDWIILAAVNMLGFIWYFRKGWRQAIYENWLRIVQRADEKYMRDEGFVISAVTRDQAEWLHNDGRKAVLRR